MDYDNELKNIPFEGQEIDMEQLYRFTDALEQDPKKREAVPAIFRFIEAHANKDIGSPGPLTHFLEEENDYRAELEQSVLTKPTALTVWMVNRIVNGAESKAREHWLAVLVKVINLPEAPTEVKESAREFIEYQSEKI